MAKNRLPKSAQVVNDAPEGSEANVNELQPIGAADTNSGQFVLDTQKTAKEEGFSRVSQLWYDKTKPMEWAQEQIVRFHADNEDVDAVFLKDVEPVLSPDDGEFVFVRDGKEYRPTPHALNLLTGRYRYGRDVTSTVSSTVATALLGVQKYTDKNGNEEFRYNSDRKYKDLYIQYLRYIHEDSRNPNDPFFWRFNNKLEQVRAVFSSQDRSESKGAPFRPINNEWLLDVLLDIVGKDARISHWRGENPDTIRFNILMPDSSLEDNGENYGGGVSVGNSEIGELSTNVCPFTFRAICMNGCIWDRLDGEAVRYAQRGKGLDLSEVEAELRKNIQIQLGMVRKGIELLINTKRLSWDGCSELPMFTNVGIKFGLSPTLTQRALEAYRVEVAESDANRNTLYGLTNSLSRAAQGWNNSRDGKVDGFKGSDWETLNRASGDMMRYSETDFDKFIMGANSVDQKDIAKYFGAEAIAN